MVYRHNVLQVGPIAHYYQVEMLRDLIHQAIVGGKYPSGSSASSTLAIVAAYESSFPDHNPDWPSTAQRQTRIARKIAQDCSIAQSHWVVWERNECTGIARTEHCTNAIAAEKGISKYHARYSDYHYGCKYSQEPTKIMVTTYGVNPAPKVTDLLQKLSWSTLMAVLQEVGTLHKDS